MPPILRHLLFDIDGTIVDYRTGTAACFLDRIRELLVSGIARRHAIDPAVAMAAWHDFTTRALVWWDYSDIIAHFQLPQAEIWRGMRQIHQEELVVLADTVDTIHTLAATPGAPRLHIVSNNPVTGCLLKLELAGLAALDHPGCFGRIFGTDATRGMKFTPATWERIRIALNSDGSDLAAVGDHPEEDGAIPRQSGIGRSFLLRRHDASPLPAPPPETVVIDSCHQLLSHLELS